MGVGNLSSAFDHDRHDALVARIKTRPLDRADTVVVGLVEHGYAVDFLFLFGKSLNNPSMYHY